MSEKEYTSYRFNDETDPTDEQLAELMRQAAQDAREKGRIANEKFFDELHKAIDCLRRIHHVRNGRRKIFI